MMQILYLLYHLQADLYDSSDGKSLIASLIKNLLQIHAILVHDDVVVATITLATSD